MKTVKQTDHLRPHKLWRPHVGIPLGHSSIGWAEKWVKHQRIDLFFFLSWSVLRGRSDRLRTTTVTSWPNTPASIRPRRSWRPFRRWCPPWREPSRRSPIGWMASKAPQGRFPPIMRLRATQRRKMLLRRSESSDIWWDFKLKWLDKSGINGSSWFCTFSRFLFCCVSSWKVTEEENPSVSYPETSLGRRTEQKNSK